MSEPRDILVVEPHVGGHTPYILQLYGALARRRPDYRPVWLTAVPEQGNPYGKQLEEGGGVAVEKVFPVEAEASGAGGKGEGGLARRLAILRRMASNARRTVAEVRRRRPALVHFQSFNPHTDLWQLGRIRRVGVPLVQTVHNVEPHKTYLSWIDPRVERAYYRRCDRILVHSDHNREEFGRRYPGLEDRLSVLPHGNYANCYPPPLPQAEARQRLGLPGDVPVCLFFGSIRPDKGLDVLLDALGRLRRKGEKPHLIIAGSVKDAGRSYQPYKEQIVRHGLQAQVCELVRFIADEEVPALFGASDLVVLPYRQVAMSGVLHLAYTMGRPVVASEVGALPETVVPGVTGRLVPAGDSAALAAAIGRLCADRSALQRMGRSAHQESLKYSWDTIAETLGTLYDALLRGRGKGV